MYLQLDIFAMNVRKSLRSMQKLNVSAFHTTTLLVTLKSSHSLQKILAILKLTQLLMIFLVKTQERRVCFKINNPHFINNPSHGLHKLGVSGMYCVCVGLGGISAPHPAQLVCSNIAANDCICATKPFVNV